MLMKICRQCGQSVQDVENYCPRCGSNKLADENVQRQPTRVPRAAAGRPVAPNGTQVSNNGGPNQHRHIQQAPAGYRNPNAVIQNPNQGNLGYNNKAAGFNNQGLNEQDDDFDTGFGVEAEEQPVQNTKKSLLGKGKQPKAPKEPKAPKMPKAPTNRQMGQQMGQQTGQQMGQQIGCSNNVITLKDWLFLFLKMAIPVYNIIMIVKILTNPYENPTLKNYFKASLILAGIATALAVIGSVVITTLFSAMMF